MNPIVERFRLIEQLDQILYWVCGGFIVIWLVVRIGFCGWKEEKLVGWRRQLSRIMDGLSYLVMLGLFAYLFWRTFFAWKGLYSSSPGRGYTTDGARQRFRNGAVCLGR